MNIDEWVIDLLVDAILNDICRDTSEWADPTGEKAVEIVNLKNSRVENFENTF